MPKVWMDGGESAEEGEGCWWGTPEPRGRGWLGHGGMLECLG